MTEKEIFNEIKELAEKVQGSNILVAVILVSIMNAMKFGYLDNLADANRAIVDVMSDIIVSYHTDGEIKQ